VNIDNAVRLMERMTIPPIRGGTRIPFRLNPNQRKAVEIVKSTQMAGRPMKFIILKSRRVGMSSLFDAFATIHCLAQANATAKILAHTHSSSQALFKIPLSLVESLPYKLTTPPTKSSILFNFQGGNSELSIATAGHSTSGRGWTLSFLHLSEVAFYPADTAFASLLPSVTGPTSWTVLESTANGTENEGEGFYEYWMQAIEGDTDFTPIFLSWVEDPEATADPSIIEGYPLDPAIDDEEEELMEKWGASYSNLAWRRLKIAGECKNRIEIFLQEYPHCPEVAFQSSGSPCFDSNEIARVRESIKTPRYTCRMELTDAGISKIEKCSDGPVLVWREPIPGFHYFIGADAARGQEEGDFAAIVMFCGETGEQVLRLAERINPEVLARFCNGLGRWYNNAMVNVELTGNLGYETLRRMRDDMHYPNLYRWKGKDDRIRRMGDRNLGGWDTTQRTREMAFTYFRAALREGLVVVRDEALLQQMSKAVEEWGAWRIRSGHDDIMFAALIAWAARTQYPPPRLVDAAKSNYMDPEISSTSILDARSGSSISYLEGVGQVTLGRFAEEHCALMARDHISKIERGRVKNRLGGV